MAGGRLVAQDGDTVDSDIVEVEEPEELVARVAAIDVAKASGMVGTRVPHPAKSGRRITKVWQVPATTNTIIELAEQLACQGIQRVVVESTSDYWRAWLYLLEARGLVVWLVNARDVKHLPGRPKTDKLDAVWLAKPQRAGHAAALVRPPGRDPPVAGLHPAALRPDPRPHPARAAAGEAARGRPDQARHGGHRHHGSLRAGHAGGAHRRPARPQGARRAGQGTDARQAR